MPWAIPGQDRVATILSEAARRDEVSHAWAFTGPVGVGQEQAARALVAALNCPEPDPPCGLCESCRRSMRGAHPAYEEFRPTGAFHRVAEVRERWTRAAFLSGVAGGWKVLRIVEADRMNEAAANAFLKALEEPPPRTTWILDLADPDELPDTILSRCRVVRFSPWSREVLDTQAGRLGLDEDGARGLAVRASFGSPTQLARLAASGGLDDLRAHREWPRRLRADGPAFALVAARALDDEVKRRSAALREEARAERDALAETYGEQPPRAVVKELDERRARLERELRTAVAQAALDDLVGWLRDVVLVASGGDVAQAVHADDPDGLRADATALSPAGALATVDTALLTRERLELNVQPGLALEALLMELSARMLPG